ncbi:MAG: aldehyde dehydrogenase family protein [candidate division KSB1 bacterium]|nr:aldehyde dehydrogenase family protein [candidate division KSB1 bacterium]MDZ7275899.1 aldehyde dehydrogenase family protein [candidate division KSB1 bacterium]MDZ7287649.1 aldehyde dehydrogenase family protein [candidate division KSB1 bacterium]MDZ7306811.1 aldehyde dehydrogenase family protein [candidate division KSB1 bacterium]MDZ7350627.1 aldehyde dehydrogenase family protein [candidate division KSB1 bacterium]
MSALLDQDLQSLQEVRSLVARAKAAQLAFKEFSQEQVDRVVAAMAEAGFKASERLARLAVEETKYGKVADKTIKNQFATRDLYASLKTLKTVGIIREEVKKKIIEIAEPMGVVAAIVPTTNPTSTAMFKCLISVKARNAVVVSPHPRAQACTLEAVHVMRTAAESAGAPPDLCLCLSLPTQEGTNELMRHRDTAVILATGGTGLVRAAYSAGKPAYGVGPGNVPVYIDRSADIPKAVADAVAGKTFDWGTLCSSEQALVVDAPVADRVLEELHQQKAYFLNETEADKVAKALVTPDFRINAEMVGQSPQRIAAAAGFSVPADTRVLVARLAGVGRQYPLSMEKLSPVLALYVEDGWQKGCDRCIELLNFGGRGHTLGIHCNDRDIILQFGLKKPAFRIIVNSPTALGAVGYTTDLDPSMTLGCGSYGGNITSDNIGPVHLLNIKRVAWETRPLAKPRDTGAWRPAVAVQARSRAEFPYQKALSSQVSRKGTAHSATPPAAVPNVTGENFQAEASAGDRTTQAPAMPLPQETAGATSTQPAAQKFGTSGLSAEEVDRIVAEFSKRK